jgi:hypothetical protein
MAREGGVPSQLTSAKVKELTDWRSDPPRGRARHRRRRPRLAVSRHRRRSGACFFEAVGDGGVAQPPRAQEGFAPLLDLPGLSA